MAEKKETIILDFEVDSDDAIVSIEKLTAANKALREERKKVDISTEAGIKRVKDINDQLDKNTNTIKDNSSAIEKQRLNVGNYTGALDKLIPGLGATANGFISVGKSIYTALVANPVGVIIGGVVLAMGLLVKIFTGGEAGGDKLAKVMSQVSAVFNVVLDRAVALGGAIVKLFSGDFVGAAADAKAAVSGVSAEMAKEIKIAGELADIIDELGNRESDYNIAASKSQNEIKKLIIASKDRTKSEQERIALLKQAHEIEVSQNQEIKGINDDKLAVAIQQFELNNSQLNLQREKDESELEYATRLASMRDAKMDDIDNLAAAIIELNKTEGESLNLQEKLSVMTAKLQEQRDAEAEKKQEVAEKQKELFDKEIEQSNLLIAKKEEENQKLLAGTLDRLAKQKEAEETAFEESIEFEEEAAEKTEEIQWATFGKKLEIWTKEHEEGIKNTLASIDLAKGLANSINTALQDHYKVKENALAVSLAKEKQELQTAYKSEVDALQAKFDAGEISKEEYDKAILGANQRYQADVKSAEIAQAKELDELRRKAFEVNKKNQIAQAVADVATAVIKAFASMAGVPLVGQILGGIAAAATVAFGAIKIAQIKNTEYVPATFKTGGYTGDGDPNQLAGQTHKGEFVIPASVVGQFGKDHFQSYMDGSVVANGRGSGGAGGMGGGQSPVYVSWKEFTDFQNQMNVKASIVEAA